MKWFLISCTLILFSFGAIHAESEEADYEYCLQNQLTQSRLAESCSDQYSNYSAAAVEREIEAVIINYSGDNAAVQALADKLCPTLKPMWDCTIIRNDLDPKCVKILGKERDEQDFEIGKGLINYGCAESGAAIIKLLQNNGIETIFDNEQYLQCLKIIFGSPDDDDEIKAFSCDKVNEGFECYTAYVRDHPNSNLATIANDLRLVFREAINCAPENEL